MKRIILLIYIFVLFSVSILGQGISVSVGNFTTNPGDTVDVPVTVTNFNNIGAVSLSIQYNSELLTYLGITAKPSYGNFTNNFTDSSIITGWFSTNPLNLGDGSFIALRFIYHRDSAALNFNVTECEIADLEGNTLPVTFNNGSIKSVEVSSTEKENFSAEEFSLSQNYPNPFNPATKIKYSIPEDSRVKILIYTITGELAAELVNEEQKRGSYMVEFHADHMANGIYMVKLSAGNFVQSKKMILLK